MSIGSAKPGTPAARQKSMELVAEATAELDRGRVEAAENLFKLAIVYDPSNQKAAEHLEQTASLPRTPSVVTKAPSVDAFKEAAELERVGDIPGAMRTLELGLDGPKRALCAHRLGVLVVKYDSDLERGYELMRMAVEAAPDKAAFKRSLEKVEKLRKSEARTPIGWITRLFTRS